MNDAADRKSGCLGMLLGLLGMGTAKPTQYGAGDRLPYRQRDDFLSAAEISFYHVLRQAVGERVTVCAKVRLSDVFFVARSNENTSARNRIQQKHVDFLLCDPATMHPLAGIELDDASHARRDRQERDELVGKVFEAAGLPLVRFPAQRAYSQAEVAGRVAAVLDGGIAAAPAQETTDLVEHGEAVTDGPEMVTGSAPLCPKCGIALVIRSGAKGQFYGCSNFPKCRTTAAME